MAKPSPWGGEPDELAPCPFCGYGDVQFTSERYDLVLCPACGTEGPATFDRGEAIAAWNRRTPSQGRWNDVRDAIEKRLRDEQIGEPYREFADELARIALGERGP